MEPKSRIGGFFGLGVTVSAMVLWALVVIEGRRAGVKHPWSPIAANLAVGVFLGRLKHSTWMGRPEGRH